MKTYYAPVFSKDGNDYLAPAGPAGIVAGIVYDTVEEAKTAGAEAGLQRTYGLVPTGEVVILEDGKYPAPYVIATIADIQAWIIGGPALDGLLAARSSAVENLSEELDPTPTATTGDPTTQTVEDGFRTVTSDAPVQDNGQEQKPTEASATMLTEENSVPVVLNGDHTGPDNG